MSEIWRTVSMEGKWKDGKGHVVLTTVEYTTCTETMEKRHTLDMVSVYQLSKQKKC